MLTCFAVFAQNAAPVDKRAARKLAQASFGVSIAGIIIAVAITGLVVSVVKYLNTFGI